MGLPEDEPEKLVAQFKNLGLDAIECHYPKYTPEQRAFYLRLAEKYRLHQTGGSDFHGKRSSRMFIWQNGHWNWSG